MVDEALKLIIRKGRLIENLRLFVSADSALASQINIDTAYGQLLVQASAYIPKGYSYILENANAGRNRAFQWVANKK